MRFLPTLFTILLASSAFAAPVYRKGDPPPAKYAKNHAGIMGKNPDYIEWQKVNGDQAALPPMKNEKEALPVVSNMEQYFEYNEASGKEHKFSESTDATMGMIQEPDISSRVGLGPDTMVDELGQVFSKYEVPLGLMNKLMELQIYDQLEFIVDDSSSMRATTDSFKPNTNPPVAMTRWEEAIARLKAQMEILAYVPTPKILIRFLNRPTIVELYHNGEKGETPKQFIEHAHAEIDRATRDLPYGNTPAFEKLKLSFDQGRGKKVSRYFFGDGEPSGVGSVGKIKKMVTERPSPKDNPLTFLSCTDQDDQTEWMKETEEVALYCSEFDDFKDESTEVLGDQGVALPYTMGFHRVAELVAAINPDDLDAMDESVPLTKKTLDNLLGIEQTEADYRYYFEEFLKAQAKKVVVRGDEVGAYKKSYNWDAHYRDFLRANYAKDIRAVQDFRETLKRLVLSH